MSEITFKKYESRPKPNPTTYVCECSHDEVSHFNIDANFLKGDKERVDCCAKCMCEHWKQVTTMPRSEYFDLHHP